jgi:hypothetical protein
MFFDVVSFVHERATIASFFVGKPQFAKPLFARAFTVATESNMV